MANNCSNCDNCGIVGYNPRKEINTISYWCEAKHVNPGDSCTKWKKGNPWEKVRRRSELRG